MTTKRFKIAPEKKEKFKREFMAALWVHGFKSRAQFARKIGISDRTLEYHVCGKFSFSADEANELAKMGVKIENFV